MSTSELPAGPRAAQRRGVVPGGDGGAAVKAVLFVAMAILAAAGIYGALNGANPGLTLAAGIGVGVLWVVATRQRGDGR